MSVEHVFETFNVGDGETYFACSACGREVMVTRPPARFHVLTDGDASIQHIGGIVGPSQ